MHRFLKLTWPFACPRTEGQQKRDSAWLFQLCALWAATTEPVGVRVLLAESNRISTKSCINQRVYFYHVKRKSEAGCIGVGSTGQCHLDPRLASLPSSWPCLVVVKWLPRANASQEKTPLRKKRGQRSPCQPLFIKGEMLSQETSSHTTLLYSIGGNWTGVKTILPSKGKWDQQDCF